MVRRDEREGLMYTMTYRRVGVFGPVLLEEEEYLCDFT